MPRCNSRLVLCVLTGGGVSVSESGAWVAYTNSPTLYVLDGFTGAVRDSITVPWGGVAPQITDTGCVPATRPPLPFVPAPR